MKVEYYTNASHIVSQTSIKKVNKVKITQKIAIEKDTGSFYEKRNQTCTTVSLRDPLAKW